MVIFATAKNVYHFLITHKSLQTSIRTSIKLTKKASSNSTNTTNSWFTGLFSVSQYSSVICC